MNLVGTLEIGVAGYEDRGLGATILLGEPVDLDFSFNEALVLGAVVSSTDAASVFSVLRGSGLQLKRRVGTTLELESGLNDPVAVILTISLTANLMHPGELSAGRIVLEVLLQLAIGGALGVGIGLGGRWLLAGSG